MEEAEVPLEHLHEEIHHSAEHGGENWISWVALSTAILAVLAAIAGLLSGKHANEAMMSQIEASDQWGYYQARASKLPCSTRKLRSRPRLTNPTPPSGIVTKKSRKKSKPRPSTRKRKRNRIFISTKILRAV